MTILRGKSDDSPTITMRVERGKLVPVSAYDLELVNQWHEGAEVNVDAVRVKVRPAEKAYFAMLSYLIKTADTPWSNTETAHDALKLAAGFAEPYRKKNGEWGAHPRHIATFTDTELSEYIAIFEGIVSERFGIAPHTLRREAPDTGFVSSGAAGDGAADDAPSARPIPVGAGVQIPPGANSAGVPEAGGGAIDAIPRDVSPPARGGVPLSRQEWDWVRQTARMLVAATEPGSSTILNNQARGIKDNLTPSTITPEAKDVGNLIYRHCLAVCKGNRPLDLKWIASVARCTLDDLRPEAR
jgi:hypothetical protein